MKRIKCELCTGVWIIEDKDLEKQKICPCCGTSIRGEIEFSEYDSLDKAIYGAVSKMGKDILQNPRQLVGFLMDTAPSLKNEIRIFSKTVNEDYAADIRYVFEQETDRAEATINKLRHLFVEREGLSDKWAETICKGLHGAVLFSKGIGTNRFINVEIIDFEDKVQLEMIRLLNLMETTNINFSDIKKRLEGNEFKNIRNGEMQNCFDIFMNNYHLLEEGVRHFDFVYKAGFYGSDFICHFFHELGLVMEESGTSDIFLYDFYKISELGTVFYKTFAGEKV